MIKEFLKATEEKVSPFFMNFPVHPNYVTLSSLFFALLFFFSSGICSLAFLILSFFADALDGIIARATKKVSKFGAYIDGICDRLVEFIILLKSILIYPDLFVPAILTLFFGTCMLSFSKAYATHRCGIDEKVASKFSPFGRAERVLLIIFAFLFPPFASQFLWLAFLLSFLSFLTVIVRVGRRMNVY